MHGIYLPANDQAVLASFRFPCLRGDGESWIETSFPEQNQERWQSRTFFPEKKAHWPVNNSNAFKGRITEQPHRFSKQQKRFTGTAQWAKPSWQMGDQLAYAKDGPGIENAR